MSKVFRELGVKRSIEQQQLAARSFRMADSLRVEYDNARSRFDRAGLRDAYVRTMRDHAAYNFMSQYLRACEDRAG